MYYELWDETSGNIITGGPTPDRALDYVRATLEQDGVAAVDELFLAVMDDGQDAQRTVLSGRVLVDLVSAVPAR